MTCVGGIEPRGLHGPAGRGKGKRPLALADLAGGPKNALPDRLNILIDHPAFVYIEWDGNESRREQSFRSVQKR